MLSPEVWRFSPPISNYKEHKRNFLFDEEKKINPSAIFDFNYTHLVSIVLPNIQEVPKVIKKSLSDCDYYKVENISLGDLLTLKFIDSFIKNGELIALSIARNIDTDNCVCFTPNGTLALSLDKLSYQQLGLEGTVSQFSKLKERYTL